MSRVLLTGGSGFLGHWIACGCPPHYRLRILARPTSDLSLLRKLNIPFERADGDLTDLDSLRVALQGCDALIHAAGWISFDRRQVARVEAANYTGTHLLFEAALAAGVRNVVYTASIFALGYAMRVPVTETSTFRGREFLDIPYVRAKVEAERSARAMIEKGLPLVRLYPGICLGPGDRNHSSNGFVVAWLKGWLPALVGGGACFLDVRDAAAAHWRALESGKAGERYLAPGYNLTHQQLFALLAHASGRAPPRLTIPAVASVAAAALYERLFKTPPLWKDEARLMARHWWYDDRRSREALGFRYGPLADTLRDTLQNLA